MCLLMTQQLRPTASRNSSHRWIVSLLGPVRTSDCMTISLRKTNIMGHDSKTMPAITIDDYELDVVCQFTYLGSAINATLSLETEIDKRIEKAASTLACLTTQVWANSELPVMTKDGSLQCLRYKHTCSL